MPSILEGIDREATNYNTNFLEDEKKNMEAVEGKDGETIRRVKKIEECR